MGSVTRTPGESRAEENGDRAEAGDGRNDEVGDGEDGEVEWG